VNCFLRKSTTWDINLFEWRLFIYYFLQINETIFQNFQDGEISISNSVMIKVEPNVDESSTKDIMISWSYKDETVGTFLLSAVSNFVRSC